MLGSCGFCKAAMYGLIGLDAPAGSVRKFGSKRGALEKITQASIARGDIEHQWITVT